jgi:uncharacterized protein (TIGR03435 family)
VNGIAHVKASLGLIVLVAAGQAQQKTFEVVSIRPSAPISIEDRLAGRANIGLKIDGAQASFGPVSLRSLVMLAFHVRTYQVVTPDWMKSANFDIAAKIPQGATRDDVPEMLRAMLTERFKLAVHRETRNLDVYALVVAKGGLKMTEAAPDTPKKYRPSVKNGVMHVEFVQSMADMANLSILADQPVIDMTGLKGDYAGSMDVPLSRTSAQGQPSVQGDAPLASDPGRSPWMDAVEPLGLRLERRTVPIEMIVVDHSEKIPTEN